MQRNATELTAMGSKQVWVEGLESDTTDLHSLASCLARLPPMHEQLVGSL